MASQSEYDDIQTPNDAKELEKLLEEAKQVAHALRTNSNVPVQLRQAAYTIEIEADETLAFLWTSPLSVFRKERSEAEEKPGVKYKRKRKIRTKEITEFTKLVKKEPKYSSAEFKCIGDFDKCKKHRGNRSVLCHLAFFICLGKRIVPFVRQK